MKLFVEGRKRSFELINAKINKSDRVIWFHCASLGEFEQGRPIIEEVKDSFPQYKIVLTFFSPSGYEVRKNYPLADVVCYLPVDTSANAKKFIGLIHPEMAIFVKYEFWPNYLNELKRNKIKTLLVSGTFREDQIFFKSYGTWMIKSLETFSHFFVQNIPSENLLKSMGFKNVTVSGDTRFDRVSAISEQDNHLDFIEKFKQHKYTLVAGSTWSKGEALLISYINKESSENEKFIIAPHNVTPQTIAELKQAIKKETVLFSDQKNIETANVFIVDTVGILTKIYSYADVAYVGGGFGTSGLHNVLEPAAFGIPILIGPNFDKFEEAKDLVAIGACEVIKDHITTNQVLANLRDDQKLRLSKGQKAKEYVDEHRGATSIILAYLKENIHQNT
ncbi:3-deoxy-D-manno-octulosonic acid transferase [Namhaeicola litoreus]|uniref:3-deoxy-D-manno-octulosonic acid transferase n=1 Tax=Namhaeicola litoreus TaxID=1052145 RepID=A0ABW3Y0H3_9FLAO